MAFKRSIKMWEGFMIYVSTLWDCVGVFDSLHFNLFPNGGFKLYIVTQQANYALAKNPKTRNGVREGEEIFHQKRKYLFYIHENPREEKKVLSTRKWKMFESCCPPSPLTVSSRCWWPFFATLLQLMVKILLQIYRLTRFQEVLKFIFRHTWKFCSFEPNYHLSSVSMVTLQQQINCRLLSNVVWFIVCFGFRWYRRCILHKYEPLIRYSKLEKKIL